MTLITLNLTTDKSVESLFHPALKRRCYQAPVLVVRARWLRATAASGGAVKVDASTVIQSDVEADNGVIHAIDTVLLPPQPKAE